LKYMRFYLIKKQKHFINYYFIWAPYILTYQLTNRHLFFSPRQFDLTRLDRAIPFAPFLLPIYVSYLVYAFVAVARSKDDRELNELFYVTHFQLFICALFFIFFPVTFPRQEYYTDGYIPGLFMNFWEWFDAPNNCFPSLHTANSALAIHYSLGKPYQWAFVAWGFLIICTTVLCKQHYVIDIAAGLAVYFASIKMRDIVLLPWEKKSSAS